MTKLVYGIFEDCYLSPLEYQNLDVLSLDEQYEPQPTLLIHLGVFTNESDAIKKCDELNVGKNKDNLYYVSSLTVSE